MQERGPRPDTLTTRSTCPEIDRFNDSRHERPYAVNGGPTRGSQSQRRSSSPHRSTRRSESGDTDPSSDRPSAIRAEGGNSSNGSSSTFLASTYRPLEKTTDVYHRDRNAEGTAQVRPTFEAAQLNVPSQKSTGLISKGKDGASARATVAPTRSTNMPQTGSIARLGLTRGN